jgi:hypothetical protein
MRTFFIRAINDQYSDPSNYEYSQNEQGMNKIWHFDRHKASQTKLTPELSDFYG